MISRHSFRRSPSSIALFLLLSTAASFGVGACSDDDDANTPSNGEAGANGESAGAGGEGTGNGAGGAEGGAAAQGGASGGIEGGEGGDRSSGGEPGAGGLPGTGGDDAGGAGGDGAGGEPGMDADDASSARYRLMQRESGKCARMTAEKSLDVVDCDDGDETQEFFLDPGAMGTVRARSAVQANQCVHVSDASATARSCTKDDELGFVKRANGGMQLKSSTGNCLIASAGKLGGGACDDAADWEPRSAGENFAIAATFVATTTYEDYYSTDYVHDGNIQLGLEGQSWTNAWTTPDLPATISIDLGQPRQFSRIDFYTSTDYEIAAFDIDWYDGEAWNSIAEVTGNVEGHLVFVFPAVVARELRVVARSGPASQPNYARVNEVLIH
jgi:hypothetical protein